MNSQSWLNDLHTLASNSNMFQVKFQCLSLLSLICALETYTWAMGVAMKQLIFALFHSSISSMHLSHTASHAPVTELWESWNKMWHGNKETLLKQQSLSQANQLHTTWSERQCLTHLCWLRCQQRRRPHCMLAFCSHLFLSPWHKLPQA